MDRMKVKILGYYNKGNFGDDLLYLSIKGMLEQLNVQCDKSTENNVPFKLGYFNSIFEADHQISVGGLLQDVTSFRSFYYYTTMMNLARSNILMGHSFGPFKSKRLCLGIMKEINGLSGVLARDWKSYQIANEVWSNRDMDIEYGTDIVFNLNLQTFSQKNPKEYEYLLIVIKKNENRNRVYELIKFAKKYLNIKIVLTAFDLHDVDELKRLKHNFYEDAMVEVKDPTKLRLEDMIDVVRNADYVFSYRLHPIILAIIFEKPFANISYNEKIMNFLSPYIELPFADRMEDAFEFIYKKLDMSKLKNTHLALAEKNIYFLKRTLNRNIFGKRVSL